MQNWNGCSSLTQHNGSNGNSIYITLTDTRDNNKYKVAKLKDGKCWMVENLRIAGRSISSTDSDMGSGSFSIPNAASNFTGTNNNAAYYDTSNGYNSGYYSWYTATAGTGTASMSTNGQNATYSICPKGWKLPTGGSGGDFEIMAKSYGSGTDAATAQALLATPVPGFVLSGWYSASSLQEKGTFGGWWSSTVYNSSYPYYLGIGSSFVDPIRHNDDKNSGNSIRCIAK